jgi:hypothetical protein
VNDPKLETNSSYPLTHEAIDQVLTRKSPGNYTLGYLDGATFVVFYVGRSDSDVGRSLHDWVGAPSRYDRYAPACKAAWACCRGDLMPLDRPTVGRVQNSETSYTHFAYSYARSAEQAYAEEWRNYDTFGGSHALDNETQPVSAAG